MGSIAETIYRVSGCSVDYAHVKLGIKYSYALELRDEGFHGFELPVKQIKPTLEETWAGLQTMAWEIAKEYDNTKVSTASTIRESTTLRCLIVVALRVFFQ